MAVKLSGRFGSDKEYLHGVAFSTGLFDEIVYSSLSKEDEQTQYLQLIAGTNNVESNSFDSFKYSKLQTPEDRLGYLTTAFYDKDNVEANEYFDLKVKQGIAIEEFNSLSDFKKTINSFLGITGEALNETLLGTIEGVIDLTLAIFPNTNDLIAKDVTGVSANREQLYWWNMANSHLDKYAGWDFISDVTTGLARLTTTLIPVVGEAVYFGSMGGNMAEEAAINNPDINYFNRFGYVATGIGVEILTEKMFGDVWFGKGMINKVRKGLPATLIGRFTEEAIEEGVAEIAQSLNYYAFVEQDPDMIATPKEIGYAALVGGMIGLISTGKKIASTPSEIKSAINPDVKISGKMNVFNYRLAMNEINNKIKDYYKYVAEENSIKAKEIADEVSVLGLALNEIFKQGGKDAVDKTLRMVEKVSDKKEEALRDHVTAVEKTFDLEIELNEIPNKINDIVNKVISDSEWNILFGKPKPGSTQPDATTDSSVAKPATTDSSVAKPATKSNANKIPKKAEEAVKSLEVKYLDHSFKVKKTLNESEQELVSFIKNRTGENIYIGNFTKTTGMPDIEGLIVDGDNIFVKSALVTKHGVEGVLTAIATQKTGILLKSIMGEQALTEFMNEFIEVFPNSIDKLSKMPMHLRQEFMITHLVSDAYMVDMLVRRDGALSDRITNFFEKRKALTNDKHQVHAYSMLINLYTNIMNKHKGEIVSIAEPLSPFETISLEELRKISVENSENENIEQAIQVPVNLSIETIAKIKASNELKKMKRTNVDKGFAIDRLFDKTYYSLDTLENFEKALANNMVTTFEEYINITLLASHGIMFDNVNKMFVLPIDLDNLTIFKKSSNRENISEIRDYMEYQNSLGSESSDSDNRTIGSFLTPLGQRLLNPDTKLVIKNNRNSRGRNRPAGYTPNNNTITINAESRSWEFLLKHEIYHSTTTGKYGVSKSMILKNNLIKNISEEQLYALYEDMVKLKLTSAEYKTSEFFVDLENLQFSEIIAGDPTKQKSNRIKLGVTTGFVVEYNDDVVHVSGRGGLLKHQFKFERENKRAVFKRDGDSERLEQGASNYGRGFDSIEDAIAKYNFTPKFINRLNKEYYKRVGITAKQLLSDMIIYKDMHNQDLSKIIKDLYPENKNVVDSETLSKAELLYPYVYVLYRMYDSAHANKASKKQHLSDVKKHLSQIKKYQSDDMILDGDEKYNTFESLVVDLVNDNDFLTSAWNLVHLFDTLYDFEKPVVVDNLEGTMFEGYAKSVTITKKMATNVLEKLTQSVGNNQSYILSSVFDVLGTQVNKAFPITLLNRDYDFSVKQSYDLYRDMHAPSGVSGRAILNFDDTRLQLDSNSQEDEALARVSSMLSIDGYSKINNTEFRVPLSMYDKIADIIIKSNDNEALAIFAHNLKENIVRFKNIYGAEGYNSVSSKLSGYMSATQYWTTIRNKFNKNFGFNIVVDTNGIINVGDGGTKLKTIPKFIRDDVIKLKDMYVKLYNANAKLNTLTTNIKAMRNKNNVEFYEKNKKYLSKFEDLQLVEYQLGLGVADPKKYNEILKQQAELQEIVTNLKKSLYEYDNPELNKARKVFEKLNNESKEKSNSLKHFVEFYDNILHVFEKFMLDPSILKDVSGYKYFDNNIEIMVNNLNGKILSNNYLRDSAKQIIDIVNNTLNSLNVDFIDNTRISPNSLKKINDALTSLYKYSTLNGEALKNVKESDMRSVGMENMVYGRTIKNSTVNKISKIVRSEEAMIDYMFDYIKDKDSKEYKYLKDMYSTKVLNSSGIEKLYSLLTNMSELEIMKNEGNLEKYESLIKDSKESLKNLKTEYTRKLNEDKNIEKVRLEDDYDVLQKFVGNEPINYNILNDRTQFSVLRAIEQDRFDGQKEMKDIEDVLADLDNYIIKKTRGKYSELIKEISKEEYMIRELEERQSQISNLMQNAELETFVTIFNDNDFIYDDDAQQLVKSVNRKHKITGEMYIGGFMKMLSEKLERAISYDDSLFTKYTSFGKDVNDVVLSNKDYLNEKKDYKPEYVVLSNQEDIVSQDGMGYVMVLDNRAIGDFIPTSINKIQREITNLDKQISNLKSLDRNKFLRVDERISDLEKKKNELDKQINIKRYHREVVEANKIKDEQNNVNYKYFFELKRGVKLNNILDIPFTLNEYYIKQTSIHENRFDFIDWLALNKIITQAEWAVMANSKRSRNLKIKKYSKSGMSEMQITQANLTFRKIMRDNSDYDAFRFSDGTIVAFDLVDYESSERLIEDDDIAIEDVDYYEQGASVYDVENQIVQSAANSYIDYLAKNPSQIDTKVQGLNKDSIKSHQIMGIIGFVTASHKTLRSINDTNINGVLEAIEKDGINILAKNDDENIMTVIKLGLISYLFNAKREFNKENQKLIDDIYRRIGESLGRGMNYMAEICKLGDPLGNLTRQLSSIMPEDWFANDSVYHELVDKVSEATVKFNLTGDAIDLMQARADLTMYITKKMPAKENLNITEGTTKERIEKISRLVDKFDAFAHMAMLSSPATHIGNLVSNWGQTMINVSDNFFASMFRPIVMKYFDKHFNPVDSKLVEDFVERIKTRYNITREIPLDDLTKVVGLVNDALIDVGASDNVRNRLIYQLDNIVNVKHIEYTNGKPTPDSVKDFVSKKYVDTKAIEYLIDSSGGKYNSSTSIMGKIKSTKQFNTEALNYVSETIQRFLRGPDQTRVRKMTIKNLERMIHATYGEDFSIINADKGMADELLENAFYRATETYFTTSNAFSDFISRMSYRHPVLLKPFFRAVLPFPRVASNILIQLYKHTPLNFLSGVKQMILDLNNPKSVSDINTLVSEVSRKFGEATSGAILMVLGALLTQLGVIGFGREENDGIVILLGDWEIKLAQMTPSLSSLMLASAVVSNGTDDDAGQRFLKVLYDQTLISNFNTMFQYNDSIHRALLINPLESYMLQYIPAVFKSFAKVIDPSVKQTSGQYRFFKRVVAGLPGLSYIVPNKVDPYTGSKLTRNDTPYIYDLFNAIIPFKITYKNYSEGERLALAYDAETTGSSGKFTINSKSYKLSGKDLEELNTKRGEIVNRLMDDLSRNNKFMRMSDEDKKKEIQKVYDKATQYVKVYYWVDILKKRFVYQKSSDVLDARRLTGLKSGISVRRNHKGSRFID